MLFPLRNRWPNRLILGSICLCENGGMEEEGVPWVGHGWWLVAGDCRPEWGGLPLLMWLLWFSALADGREEVCNLPGFREISNRISPLILAPFWSPLTVWFYIDSCPATNSFFSYSCWRRSLLLDSSCFLAKKLNHSNEVAEWKTKTMSEKMLKFSIKLVGRAKSGDNISLFWPLSHYIKSHHLIHC